MDLRDLYKDGSTFMDMEKNAHLEVCNIEGEVSTVAVHSRHKR